MTIPFSLLPASASSSRRLASVGLAGESMDFGPVDIEEHPVEQATGVELLETLLEDLVGALEVATPGQDPRLAGETVRLGRHIVLRTDRSGLVDQRLRLVVTTLTREGERRLSPSPSRNIRLPRTP